ncbi:hypothetical protein [Natrinema sp. CGMCC1.2065]|uniref:hypothetical protein n=1 Tax=Natrinema sp. CGMCC1.2065 TaxID=3445767 RepID=UPI003F49DCB0
MESPYHFEIYERTNDLQPGFVTQNFGPENGVSRAGKAKITKAGGYNGDIIIRAECAFERYEEVGILDEDDNKVDEFKIEIGEYHNLSLEEVDKSDRSRRRIEKGDKRKTVVFAIGDYILFNADSDVDVDDLLSLLSQDSEKVHLKSDAEFSSGLESVQKDAEPFEMELTGGPDQTQRLEDSKAVVPSKNRTDVYINHEEDTISVDGNLSELEAVKEAIDAFQHQ